MSSLYTFCEYSSDWPQEFEREAGRLRGFLNENVIEIYHIGSTSIPGMATKPVIDLLPVVASISTVDDQTPMLQNAGYKAWGEFGLPGRRFFSKDRNGYRIYNIHIYGENNPEIDRHLAFCAYLREHEDSRKEYETLKRAVFARYPANIDAYMDGKNDWIKRLEPIAIEWYQLNKK